MQYSKQKIAWSLLVIMLVQVIFAPVSAYALTGGPQQPEFKSFTPVGASNMVNNFTGDFSYNLPVLNIPGPEGGGYALSLGYNADPGMESPASWVGYGWTLNPGSVLRTKRGLPDDFHNKKVTQYNKIAPSFSVAGTTTFGIEFFSKKNENNNNGGSLSSSLSVTKRYNNYTGFSTIRGVSPIKVTGRAGPISASASTSFSFSGRNDVQFSANVSISAIREHQKQKKKVDAEVARINSEFAEETLNLLPPSGCKGVRSASQEKLLKAANAQRRYYGTGGSYSISSIAQSNYSTTISKYFSVAANFGYSFHVGAPIGGFAGQSLAVDVQFNDPKTEFDAYGYMNNPGRATHENSSDPVMSDYYKEKESMYSTRDQYLGIPFNNADYFMATGEALSGSFRLHHNTVGNYYLNKTYSQGVSGNVGIDLGITATPGVEVGTSFGVGYSFTKSGIWYGKSFGGDFNSSSNMDDFEFWDGPSNQNNKPYFRFQGDLGGILEYTDNTLAESAELLTGSIEPTFPTGGTGRTIATSSGTRKSNPGYNGQSSDIRYVMNEDIMGAVTGASSTIPTASFEKNWRLLNMTETSRNDVAYSKNIAQLAVTNPDGLNYVYGLPTYVKDEASLSYGILGDAVIYHNSLAYQKVKDDPLDNKKVVGEKYNSDAYYASAYLITQITTPDYVDITQNGPSDDDFGGYTRFDYRKNENWYSYKSPYTGLAYSRGKLADKKDDFGTAESGQRETYHLNAIETKSHIAIFITNKTVAATDFAHLCPSCSNNPLLADKYNGSDDTRFDGLSAIWGAGTDGKAYGYDEPTAKGATESEMLERIVLFSKKIWKKARTTLLLLQILNTIIVLGAIYLIIHMGVTHSGR